MALFHGAHVLAADLTRCPELAITEAEAKQLLARAGDVARHYPIETTQKSIDILALFGAMGMIYGGRIAAIGIRRRREQQAPPRGNGIDAMPPASTAAPEQTVTVMDEHGNPVTITQPVH